MNEKRKQPRKNLVSYSQVFDLYGARLLGYLADITLLGAMVIGERTVDEDSAITLQIEVPEIEGVAAKRLSIPARVVWCHRDISPEYYNIGFEFSKVQPDQETVIQSIIDAYEFKRKLPDYPFRASTK